MSLQEVSEASVGADFDDTVLDTFGTVHLKIQETARIVDLPVPDKERIAESYDFIEPMVEKLFPGIEPVGVERFIRLYTSFTSLDFPYYPVHGALEAMDSLARSGMPLWLYTARPLSSLRERSRQAGIDLGLFRFIITRDDTHPYKKTDQPAWGVFGKILDKLGVNRKAAVYVEDLLANYIEASRIGLDAVLYLGSPNSRGYEGVVGPDNILHAMRHLPELVERRRLMSKA